MVPAADELARRRLIANCLVLNAIVCAAALLIWPAESVSWYPACPVARYLHVLCPGCGATRALSALLRGHFGDALRWNPLFVAVLPFLLGFGAECYRRATRPGEFLWPQVPPGAVYVALGCAAVFMAARNGITAAF